MGKNESRLLQWVLIARNSCGAIRTSLMVALLVVSTHSLHAAEKSAQTWTASWGSSQLKSYGTDAIPAQAFEDATLRQTLHLSIGGTQLRLRISNAFGETPLVLRSVQVGRTLAGKPGTLEPGSQIAVGFDGVAGVSVPASAEYLSDPVDLNFSALSDVVVSMMIAKVPETITFHAGARATSFLLKGDHVVDAQLEAAQSFQHWYFLSEIDVTGKTKAAAVVTFGDSITDGHGATTDANDRWPDMLARRLAGKGIGVVNRGIGGNRVLQDGLGPNALARFDRDVLSTAGVRYLIVFEGINDLGELERMTEHSQQDHDDFLARLEGALNQIAAMAHVHGIRVYGGTLTPYVGSEYYHPSARSETDRQSLNHWIRTSGVFDEIIDFDAMVRDPDNPERLAAEADSGDHLHPGPAGYKRIGEGVALSLFKH